MSKLGHIATMAEQTRIDILAIIKMRSQTYLEHWKLTQNLQ